MIEQPAACRIRVEALGAAFQPQAEQWAERLGLPLQVDDGEFALQVGEQGLQLQQLGAGRAGTGAGGLRRGRRGPSPLVRWRHAGR